MGGSAPGVADKRESACEWAERMREEGLDVTIMEKDPEVTTVAFLPRSDATEPEPDEHWLRDLALRFSSK
jgi:hypothetical protein